METDSDKDFDSTFDQDEDSSNNDNSDNDSNIKQTSFSTKKFYTMKGNKLYIGNAEVTILKLILIIKGITKNLY
jgi:hypothetical protein